MADLSLAQRQLLEIAKALSLEARLVIMDEPTSSLTLSETDRLMGVIADLKAHGVSIIFISHRLNEIKRCADRVVVLRDGKVVGELAREEIDPPAMIRLMIGRDLKSLYIPPQAAPGETILELVDLKTSTYPGHAVSLSVAQRRDPGPRRPRRLGPDGARPGDVRHRRAGRRGPCASAGRPSRSAPRARPSSAASIWCRRTARS